jgi:hypothetical protein
MHPVKQPNLTRKFPLTDMPTGLMDALAHRLGPLRPALGREGVGGLDRCRLVLGVVDLGQGLLRDRVRRLGTRRARCRSCATNSVAPWCRERRRGSPSRTQRPIADREHRGGHAAAFAVAQQVNPRRTRFAEPVGHGDQLLGRVGAHPDHHQQAHVVLLEANLEVDPVDPHLHVVDLGQRPGGERAGVVLPLLGQPGDRGRRQPWLVSRNCSNAGARSLVDKLCRYSSGNASAICATSVPGRAGSRKKTGIAARWPRRCACR